MAIRRSTATTTVAVDPRFITNLKGKEFILYAGLLDIGHKIGIKKMSSLLVQAPSTANNNTAIVKVEVTDKHNRVFEALGDANPNNVGSLIAPHIIRMAETRAYARALRLLTNIGMTALEELGDLNNVPDMPNVTATATIPQEPVPAVMESNVAPGPQPGTADALVPGITEDQRRVLRDMVSNKRITARKITSISTNSFGRAVVDLTAAQAEELIESIERMLVNNAAA